MIGGKHTGVLPPSELKELEKAGWGPGRQLGETVWRLVGWWKVTSPALRQEAASVHIIHLILAVWEVDAQSKQANCPVQATQQGRDRVPFHLV